MFLNFLIFTLASQVLSFPINVDRIIFLDEYEQQKNEAEQNFINNQIRLLNDSMVLISENMTLEFLLDQQGTENLENGEHFQGDMVMLEEQLNTLNDTGDVSYRTGIRSEKYRWPKNAAGNVIVPFEISKDFSLVDQIRIVSAMISIETFSCITFEKRKGQTDYINIISDDGCYSNIGKIGGGQKLSLQIGGCLSQGTIIHELMHSLGFDHMQNHADRDEYIDINWSNIKPGYEHNFNKVNSQLFENFGTPYDYYSVMHYSSNCFSKNNIPTIVSKFSLYKNVIGNRVALSMGDITRLNAMYKCKRQRIDETKFSKLVEKIVSEILLLLLK